VQTLVGFPVSAVVLYRSMSFNVVMALGTIANFKPFNRRAGTPPEGTLLWREQLYHLSNSVSAVGSSPDLLRTQPLAYAGAAWLFMLYPHMSWWTTTESTSMDEEMLCSQSAVTPCRSQYDKLSAWARVAYSKFARW